MRQSERAMTATRTVTFARTGRTATWDDDLISLLEFAEDHGLAPDFSCRSGICSTCRTRIIEGEVRYMDEPLDPPDDGEALICCAQPVGDIVLDL